MATLCVDASLVVPLLIPEQRTQAIDIFWDTVLGSNADLVGPPLLYAETVSVLRLRVYRRELSSLEGESRVGRFLGLGIEQRNPSQLQTVAWEMARRFNHPRAYDAQYLAVAELEGCELWTVDRRLYNSVKSSLPWVRLVQA